MSSIENQDKITSEMTIYMKAKGLFGLPLAVRQRATRAPGNLFYNFLKIIYFILFYNIITN